MCTVWRCAKSVAKTADLGKRNLLKSSIAMNLLRERSSRSNIRQHSYFFYFCIAKSSAKCERKQRRRCKMNAPKGCSRSPFARSIHYPLRCSLLWFIAMLRLLANSCLLEFAKRSNSIVYWLDPTRKLYACCTQPERGRVRLQCMRSWINCATLYHIFW